MKFEINNGRFVGTAEWQGPGRVALEMEDPRDRQWFESYFSAEDSFMAGPVESAEMEMHRRDSSETAFEHAAFRLAAYSFNVRRTDDSGRPGGKT